MPRMTFPAKLADLEFSIEAPAGFGQPPLPEDEQPDFQEVTKTFPLALLASPVAMVVLTVSARPAYADGSVLQWLHFLAAHFGITLTGLMPGNVGPKRTPAILGEGKQEQDGTHLRMLFAAIEDGGRLVLVHAMCPEELWASFEAPLRVAVNSFDLARPRGATAPLVPEEPALPAKG